MFRTFSMMIVSHVRGSTTSNVAHESAGTGEKTWKRRLVPVPVLKTRKNKPGKFRWTSGTGYDNLDKCLPGVPGVEVGAAGTTPTPITRYGHKDRMAWASRLTASETAA